MPAVKPSTRTATAARPVGKGAKKAAKSENTSAYVIGIAFFLVVAAGLAIWAHTRVPRLSLPPIAFTEIKAVRVYNNGYAMLATLAVQTDESDAGWVKRNEKAVREVLSHALAETDPRTLHADGGYRKLQKTLAEALNRAYPSAHAEDVIVTDFIYQEQDE